MSLPEESFTLKSTYNDKYLCYISEDTQLRGFLHFSGDELLTPYSKFKAEMAKTAGGFVNIRCVYNNKYWVRLSENEEWIIAGADEPDEVPSSWSCTLFQPFSVDGDSNASRLRHVHLDKFVSLSSRASPPFNLCLSAESSDFHPQNLDVMIVTTIPKVLPPSVAFKGDNGEYLKVVNIGNSLFLKFSATDLKDQTVWYKTDPNNNGSTRLKSTSDSKYWRCSDNWIHVDSDRNTSSDHYPATLFFPIEVDGYRNSIALCANYNHLYCQRYTSKQNSDKANCLIANASAVTEHAKLQVVEPPISRSIHKFEFNQLEVRFYDRMNLEVATSTGVNESGEEHLPMEFDLSYLHTVTKTWGSSTSIKIFNQVNIEAQIPIAWDGKKKGIREVSLQDYIWGEPFTTTTKESFHSSETVPPKTRVKVKLIATKVSVDVPFIYTQRDTLVDGRQISFDFDDGIHTVTEFLDFTTEIETEPLGA